MDKKTFIIEYKCKENTALYVSAGFKNKIFETTIDAKDQEEAERFFDYYYAMAQIISIKEMPSDEMIKTLEQEAEKLNDIIDTKQHESLKLSGAEKSKNDFDLKGYQARLRVIQDQIKKLKVNG